MSATAADAARAGRGDTPRPKSLSNDRIASDPRTAMAARLPAVVQPFLTWLTAKPAPGELVRSWPPSVYILQALSLTMGGMALAYAGAIGAGLAAWLEAAMIGLGLLLASSGLGLLQVVIFHHCAHGTVLTGRGRNRTLGWTISALLLFKHFDAYRREHLHHHSADVIFTDTDEFTDFVVGLCEFRPGTDRRALWRRLCLLLVSPVFHGRFLAKRIQGAWWSADPWHNLFSASTWTVAFGLAVVTGTVVPFLVAVVLPVTILLQAATVLRILVEHRVPPPEVIADRGRALVCAATAAVFPGRQPPKATGLRGLGAWALWWLDMLTVQMFVRLFVLVGDAPCHDFHHRRPGKRWTGYTHERQADIEAGSPGFPADYIETWTLGRAIDQNFAALAAAPAGSLG